MTQYIIGIDEVGRGPLAGPVTVCAVMVLKKEYTALKKHCPNLKDSKKLSPEMRQIWLARIKHLRHEGKIKFAHASVTNKIIDRKGIVEAIRIALRKSLEKLQAEPRKCTVLLDGSLFAPKEFKHQKTIIKGDEKECVISLASIIAKVNRDNHMKRMAKKYPDYGFEIHKGYGTAFHRAMIKKNGHSAFHRLSFIKSLLS